MWRAPCGRWTRWNITAGGRRGAVPQGKATRLGHFGLWFFHHLGLCISPSKGRDITTICTPNLYLSLTYSDRHLFLIILIFLPASSVRPVHIFCCLMVTTEPKRPICVRFGLWTCAPPCNHPPPTNLLTLHIRFCIVRHLHTNTWTMNETQTFTIGDMIYCISIFN